MRVFVLVCKMVTDFSHCCTLLCEVSTVLPGNSQLSSPRIWAQPCDFYWLMGAFAPRQGCPLLPLGTICHRVIKLGLTSHRRRDPVVYHLSPHSQPRHACEDILDQPAPGQLVQTRKTAQCFLFTTSRGIIKMYGSILLSFEQKLLLCSESQLDQSSLLLLYNYFSKLS